MSGAIDLAALRREREARRGAPPPVDSGAADGSGAGGRRLDGADAAPPAKHARPAAVPTIWCGGALKDASGSHSLRPPPVPARAVEVDCRKSSTEVKVVGRVASFAPGLGALRDKPPETDAEKRLATEFLVRDAGLIDRSLSRGEDVWVHCAQGFNRGPSGVLAYLLLYTDADWKQACRLVEAARPRARGKRNTFRHELKALGPRLFRRDHTAVIIRDGGNDPCDDQRR